MIRLIFLLLLLVSCSNTRTNNISVDKDSYNILVPDKPTNIEVEEFIDTRPQLIQPLLDAIYIQTEEKLPFDEPRREYGLQLDGKLRPEWWRAYRKKKLIYIFNGNKYGTISKGGVPFVPQVCADFIVDSIDRAAGTWYNKGLANPHRIAGRFDLRKAISEEELNPRSVTGLIEYFKNHPDDFEFLFEGKSSTNIGNISKLESFLLEYRASVGDIVFIDGRVPWDRYHIHKHSFFITGINDEGYVDKIVGNSVYPVERSLTAEGKRTPNRYITHIIRLKSSFLQRLL